MTREGIEVELNRNDHKMMLNTHQKRQQYQDLNFIQQLNDNLIHKTTNTTTLADDQENSTNNCDSLSTIAILRRHPMYDSLVLIKRYRACLNGYTLEFPTSDIPAARESNKDKSTPSSSDNCSKTKLVSLYLDGDDPIYQCQEQNCKGNNLLSPEGEIVHVPMNGLLSRLDNYDKHGVSIDSRVYAFAIGLKTAEKFLSTSSIKELSETPPL